VAAVQPWRPDRNSPHAQNVDLVLSNAVHVREHVAVALRSERRAVVLGGDCTTGLGTLAGAVAVFERPSWLYFDRHADLNTTANVRDGALDWTGLAHALALPDTIPQLTELVGAVPMIVPERILLFSHDLAEATGWEREQIRILKLERISSNAVEADPSAAAAAALRALAHRPIVVHFDVDAINFTDAPLSEHTGRGAGITLDAAMTALKHLMIDPRVCALTITELNPDHAAADPQALRTFVAGLVDALTASGE
jgi:arginase